MMAMLPQVDDNVEDTSVQAIAKELHTDAVKKAYIAKVEESK